jgi:hypothetical protein
MKHLILPKNCKLPEVNLLDTSAQRLTQFRCEAEKHIGQSAIWTFPEKRGTDSKLVEIYQVYERFVVVQYSCYDPSGKFRQRSRTSIPFASMLGGEHKLKYIDDEI